MFHICTSFESVQCMVSAVDTDTNTVHFDPTVGCDQGPQAFQTGGLGWYADNVKVSCCKIRLWDGLLQQSCTLYSHSLAHSLAHSLHRPRAVQEECDFPGEYYVDHGEKALYYTFNATERPTGKEEFALTTAKVIFNISGSQAHPVKDLTIHGLTIRDAALTYLGTTQADIHFMPSDSDWTIQRSGAVLVEGTESFAFTENLVTRCDGNGLFLSNFNRNASIASNEFSWIGDNALAALGSMGPCLYANCSVRLEYRNVEPATAGSSGVDGRGGNQPRYTRVIGNLVREVGLWQKQSGAWVQHLTAATHLEGNVFMNGPHSMINFNDGFGGGDEVVGNLMFNSNRQTIWHGIIK